MGNSFLVGALTGMIANLQSGAGGVGNIGASLVPRGVSPLAGLRIRFPLNQMKEIPGLAGSFTPETLHTFLKNFWGENEYRSMIKDVRNHRGDDKDILRCMLDEVGKLRYIQEHMRSIVTKPILFSRVSSASAINQQSFGQAVRYISINSSTIITPRAGTKAEIVAAAAGLAAAVRQEEAAAGLVAPARPEAPAYRQIENLLQEYLNRVDKPHLDADGLREINQRLRIEGSTDMKEGRRLWQEHPGTYGMPATGMGAFRGFLSDTIQKEPDPCTRAALLFLGIVGCHPFANVNGRTARFAYSVELLRHGYFMPLTNTEEKDLHGLSNDNRWKPFRPPEFRTPRIGQY